MAAGCCALHILRRAVCDVFVCPFCVWARSGALSRDDHEVFDLFRL